MDLLLLGLPSKCYIPNIKLLDIPTGHGKHPKAIPTNPTQQMWIQQKYQVYNYLLSLRIRWRDFLPFLLGIGTRSNQTNTIISTDTRSTKNIYGNSNNMGTILLRITNKLFLGCTHSNTLFRCTIQHICNFLQSIDAKLHIDINGNLPTEEIMMNTLCN